MYKDIKRLTALASIGFIINVLAVTASGSCRTVGIKAGDWVKYSVTRLGSSNFAWIHPDAVWIKVEVLAASDMTVTVRETIHDADGTESVKNFSLNLENDRESPSYIIAADLEPGDKVGEYVIWKNGTNESVYVDLTITDAEFRSYSGLTRELNVMKFHWVTPWFTEVANFTWEKYWDRQTGFLLEQKATCYLLGYEELGYNKTHPASTYKVEIADTNMWEMETRESFPWQSLAVAISVGAIIVAAVTIKLRNNRKKNGVREENDENESLCYDWRDSSTHTVNCNDNLGDHVLCHSLEIRHFGHNFIRWMVRLGCNCHRRGFKTKKVVEYGRC